MISTLFSLILLFPPAVTAPEPAPWTDSWCQERFGGDGYGPLPLLPEDTER